MIIVNHISIDRILWTIIYHETCFLNNIVTEIGFDPRPTVYDFNEDTGIATLNIVTNAPDVVNAGGALFYTSDGTATSSGGIIKHAILLCKSIDGSGLDFLGHGVCLHISLMGSVYSYLDSTSRFLGD
jgi:hypothetical protein